MTFDFQMNPDFERELATMLARMDQALKGVSAEYAGKPVEEIKKALQERVAAASDGASITDPELTTAATLIHNRKRVWLEGTSVMGDD